MLKFFILCLMAIVGLAAAKPGIVSSPLVYSSPVIGVASPYTAGFASPYYGAYASPYYGSLGAAHYLSPYTAGAYAGYGGYAGGYAGYGGYHHPYGASFILKR